jgi:hypothetical protein
VELGAYECLVLDDLREVVSTADEPWAGLAGVLHGRGVPSLDEALADHRLRPVHAAVRRVLVATTAADVAARRTELATALGMSRGWTGSAASNPTQVGDVDPAARATVRLRPLDRARFDSLRVGSALRAAGLDAEAIERTRVALGLAHPRTTPDATALARSWLADPEVRAFLQVHEWDGVEWLVRERWVTLVRLADALDRASGAKRTSAAIARLLPAAERAGDRVDRIVAAVAPTASKDTVSAGPIAAGTRPRTRPAARRATGSKGKAKPS